MNPEHAQCDALINYTDLRTTYTTSTKPTNYLSPQVRQFNAMATRTKHPSTLADPLATRIITLPARAITTLVSHSAAFGLSCIADLIENTVTYEA